MGETQFIYTNPCLQWGDDNETRQWKAIESIEWRPRFAQDRIFYIPGVWIPNSASSIVFDEMDYKSTPIAYFISNKGKVAIDTPKIFHLDCEIHYQKFPFDRSVCSIQFESMSIVQKNQITGKPQDWFKEEMRLEMWTMRKLHSVNFNKTYYTQPPGVYSSITYYFEINRKGILFVHTLILPSVLLLILQLAFILLPPVGEGRAVYSMTVMLASSVLMTSVLSEIPRTSQHIAFIFNLSVQTIIGTLCTLYSLVSISLAKHPKLKERKKFCGRQWILMSLLAIVSSIAIVVNIHTFFDMLS